MKRFRFVVLILLLLGVAMAACQSPEVVETEPPVLPSPTITPQALQQLGVSEVMVESMVDLKPGQEIVLADISALVAGEAYEVSEYIIYGKIPSFSEVGPLVIQLPLQPHGDSVDFNLKGDDDPGVQAYALKVQEALVDTAPLSGEYTTLAIPPLAGLSLQFDTKNYANIKSGWILVWAADNQQMFSVGSGEDSILFTDDDPMQPLELGYTAMLIEDGKVTRFRDTSSRVVFSTNQSPLTFDLSGMDASAVYDEALSVLQSYYPGWDKENGSALGTIKSSYSDDELQFSAMVAALEDDMVKFEPQEGGYMWLKSLYPADYGIHININEENEIRPSEIRLYGPADEVGLEYGDEILKVNGKPVLDVINSVKIPFISARSVALQQKLKAFFLFRGVEGQEMELEIRTLRGEMKTISMEAEIDSSWLLDGLDEIIGYEYSVSIPVEYESEGEYGYIRINDFDEDPQLTRGMFLDALENFKEKELNYLLLDYRKANGAQFLELASYFMDQDLLLGSLDCLGSFTQPVVVHPAEQQFEFENIAVITGEACSGVCELEVMAMQQLDNVTTYGMNNSAGSLNAGAKATILLPEQNHISFPVCQFSTNLFDEKLTIEPDVKLANNYLASIAKDDLYIRETSADLLIRNEVIGDPEGKPQSLNFMEIYNFFHYRYSPDFIMDNRIMDMMQYHDVKHYDFYDFIDLDEDFLVSLFFLCSTDYKAKAENNKITTVNVSLDGQPLTDFAMSTGNYLSDDAFGRFEDQPCMGWMVSYEKLTPGHHQILVTVDIEEPVFYEETYFEPGSYEFTLHYLVSEEEESTNE